MRLPEAIAAHVGGLTPTPIDVGFSGDSIVRYGDRFVLKRMRDPDMFRRECAAGRWLEGRLPVPRVVETVTSDGYGWLLTTVMDGVMSFMPPFGEQNRDLTTELLAQGLGLLAAVDIADCPLDRGLDYKLTEGRRLVERGEVSMEHWESTTDFKSPESLLEWLERNRPQEQPCFTHGDYCMPNIFFDAHPHPRVAGFVDLGLCGVADRWQDIALCARSMGYNRIDGGEGGYKHREFGASFDRLLEILGVERDEHKLRYYILLDELF